MSTDQRLRCLRDLCELGNLHPRNIRHVLSWSCRRYVIDIPGWWIRRWQMQVTMSVCMNVDMNSGTISGLHMKNNSIDVINAWLGVGQWVQEPGKQAVWGKILCLLSNCPK